MIPNSIMIISLEADRGLLKIKTRIFQSELLIMGFYFHFFPSKLRASATFVHAVDLGVIYLLQSSLGWQMPHLKFTDEIERERERERESL